MPYKDAQMRRDYNRDYLREYRARKKRAPETHEQKTRRLERNKRYYESHKDEVKFRNALYRCDVPGYSHTGYPMTVLDAAYAALERALTQRREWKRRQAS